MNTSTIPRLTVPPFVSARNHGIDQPSYSKRKNVAYPPRIRHTKPVIVASSFEKSPQTIASNDEAVVKAVGILKQASTNSSIPAHVVFDSMRTLERAKLSNIEGWPETIGGNAPPGRRWRLIFTSGTKEVQKALKGGKGSGTYFPVTACQRWDATNGEIENGIYLGHLASLTFSGPYSMKGKKLQFDFDTLKIKVGGFKTTFNLKKKIVNYTPSQKDPFFTFFYIDDEIVAGRGRSGGVAFWARTTPAEELKKGIA